MKPSSRAFALAAPVIGLWTALLGWAVRAQVPLNDPTRAPFQLRAPAPNPYQASPVVAPVSPVSPVSSAAPVSPGSPAPIPSGAPPGSVSAPAEVAPPGHRVTSVMLGSGSRPSSAIVDGRLVRMGDRIDGLLLVGIDASGVTLQAAAAKGGKATRRLPLFARPPEPPPEVEPKPKDGERPDKDKP